jgi:hypothetical protein
MKRRSISFGLFALVSLVVAYFSVPPRVAQAINACGSQFNVNQCLGAIFNQANFCTPQYSVNQCLNQIFVSGTIPPANCPTATTLAQGCVKPDGTTITISGQTISAVGSGASGANPTATAGPAAVNGSATTFLRSDGAPAVQKGSAAQFGIVECDNVTITCPGGVLTGASQSSGANPTATAGPIAVNGAASTFMRSDAAPAVQKGSNSQFGIIESDGSTINCTSGVCVVASITLGAQSVAPGATLTSAQLTAQLNLATAALQGALPAWPNNTTTYFRGDGTYQTLNCAALTNGAASCSTDTTNASNISSGTLGVARLPAGLSASTFCTSWTPTDQSGAGLPFTAVSAQFCQIGNLVFVYGTLTYPPTADTSSAKISLPVAVPNQPYALVAGFTNSTATTSAYIRTIINSSTAGFYAIAGAQATNVLLTGLTLHFEIIYPAL